MTNRTPSAMQACISRASEADAEALAVHLGDALLASDPGEGVREPSLLVDAAAIVSAARFLRDERGFQYLRSLTAVDFLEARPRFQVVYHFAAIPAGMMNGDPTPRDGEPTRVLRLKVGLPAEAPVVDTLTELYPTANWHERETYDMFGIEFAGHPDMRRILLPNDFEGHPLRKDHPLTYEEVAFSFNQEEIYARKPFAKE